MENINDKEEISSLKDFLSKYNLSESIVPIVAILGFVCYQLGYCFVFGYFFGGEGGNFNLLDTIINQIGFDFRILAATGGIIMFFLILITSFSVWLSFKMVGYMMRSFVILLFSLLVLAIINIFIYPLSFVYIISYVSFFYLTSFLLKITNKHKKKTKKDFTVKMMDSFLHLGIIILIGLAAMAFLSSIMFNIGDVLGENGVANSMNKITYRSSAPSSKEFTVKGVIVSQTGNTYFISTQNRTPLVITSTFVKVEPLDDATP